MRADDGQASLEYVGVVAVVAVVLALLAAPASSGEQAAGAVVSQLHRALCVVAHGDCDEGRRPCVLASNAVEDAGHVDLVVLHSGSRELVLRETRSDGRVAVTFLRQGENGLVLGTGQAVRVRVGRRLLEGGTELTARVLRLSGEGRTWVLDPVQADALARRLVVADAGDLVDRIGHGGADLGSLPTPAETATQHGLRVEFGAAAHRGKVGGELTLSAEDLSGSTVDAATGRRTYLLRRSDELAVALSAGGRGAAEGAGAGEAAFTVTVDRAGRPLDLGVLQAGELHGAMSLPAPAQEVAGSLGVSSTAGRRWELERHLDLTDPANLAAARDVLEQVVDPRLRLGSIATVGAALRARLDLVGVADVRTYAIDEDATGVGVDGEAGLVRLGAGFERVRRGARLLAAMQRGPDGIWRRRVDCPPAIP